VTWPAKNLKAESAAISTEPKLDLDDLRSLEQALADLRRKHSQIADQDADKATLERMIRQLEAEIEERSRRN